MSAKLRLILLLSIPLTILIVSLFVDDKELNINEKDIFIRYAIYMGVQEIQYYIHHKIFGGF